MSDISTTPVVAPTLIPGNALSSGKQRVDVRPNEKAALESDRSDPNGIRHVVYIIDKIANVAGGAEGAILKLTRFLPRDRYRCSVVTFSAESDIASSFPCPVHILPLQCTYDWTAFKTALELARLLKTSQADIVHTFFSTSDLWGGAVSKLSGCPILISSRRDMGILRSRKHRFAYRMLRRMFDQVQTVSDQVREFCISADHLDPRRVMTIRNGIDLEAIDAAAVLSGGKASLGLAETTNVVVTVANVRFVKGIDVLIRAVPLVCKAVPGTVFLIIGESHYQTYLDDLKALAHSLCVDENVRFLGLRNDVPSLLKASDVFCLPSRSEGMSNALLEAMACGLPCVATDVGGNSEVIENGTNGFLVPNQDAESLASRLITLQRDKHLAAAMGQAGRQLVRDQFTVQQMVTGCVAMYDRLLDRPQQPASMLSAGSVSKLNA